MCKTTLTQCDDKNTYKKIVQREIKRKTKTRMPECLSQKEKSSYRSFSNS